MRMAKKRKSKLLQTLRNFGFRDRSGAVALAFTIIAPILVLMIVTVTQYSRNLNSEAKMQQSVDSALLAAAIEVNGTSLKNPTQVEATMKAKFEDYFRANFKENPVVDLDKIDLSYDPSTKGVEASVTYKNDDILAKILSQNANIKKAETETFLAQETMKPLTLYLVLDRSGSMRGSKMTSLKAAVRGLHDHIVSVDPDKKYVRVGANAYNHSLRGFRKPVWGSQTALSFTNSLSASGGTNSSPAMSTAYSHMRGNSENIKHQEKNTGDPKRAILFMTDGSNNRTSWDSSTKYKCTQAKNDGIEIYSVAFRAPSRGRALLRACASSSEHYFEASNTSQLIQSFQLVAQATTKELSLAK